MSTDYFERQRRENNKEWWRNFWGITVIVGFVILIFGAAIEAKHETTKHTMTCNPMGTNIIGMDLNTVKKVCGDPWVVNYEGQSQYVVKITLHYTGGDIFLIAHGANLVSSQVIGWLK
jgi:hypothetical protein